MDEIVKLLLDTSKLIEDGKGNEAISLLSQAVDIHPEYADERLKAEISLLTKQMEYREILKEWEYFYSMKLVYQYCEKKYMTRLPIEDTVIKTPMPDRDIIWWCWLQGLEEAPDVVKACYRSLEKMGRQIVILTEENLHEFLQLPDWIMEKYQRGIINRTHLSDLIRIELLTTRGGTWIDSTVFCSDTRLIADILKGDCLFAYSFMMRDSINQYMLFDSWLLHAPVKSSILEDVKKLLYAYWKEEDRLMHYFLFHLMFSISCRRHPKEWESIPVFSIEPCHVLQYELMEEFQEERWKQILKMSDVHKLTYKTGDNSQAGKGTFLAHLLADEN